MRLKLISTTVEPYQSELFYSTYEEWNSLAFGAFFVSHWVLQYLWGETYSIKSSIRNEPGFGTYEELKRKAINCINKIYLFLQYLWEWNL